MTRRLFALFAVPLIVHSGAEANPLAGYRWKRRILVIDFPKSAKAELKGVEKQIAAEKKALAARDLIFFDVGELRMESGEEISETVRQTIRRHLNLGTTSADASIVLLGKDGGVKSRQTSDFDLSRFYALIDTMPMRLREIRERGE